MFTKFISKNIQEKMKAKERALARKPNSGNLSMKDMATRTPFVRMASNKLNVRLNRLIEGGLRAGSFNNKQFTFGRAYEDGDFGAEVKPLPGIKSIECSYKGGFKAIRECTVNWVVPHIDMLNELTPHFFTVGKTVVVDWGWVYGSKNLDSQLTDTFIYFGNDKITSLVNEQQVVADVRNVLIDQNIFNNPQDLILKKDGDYDAIGGQITNFEYNLREDGGFDCTTKIISMGAALFKKPVDRGGNQAGLKVKGKTAKSTPPDSLVNCILNLKNIILTTSFKINSKFVNNKSIIEHIAKNKDFEQGTGDYSSGGMFGMGTRYEKTIVRKPDYFGFKKDNHNALLRGDYALNFDRLNNSPHVLWATMDNPMEFFVTWGWMEDNIINRYVSFRAGEDKVEAKLTMRSIETVLDKSTGKPISYKEYEELDTEGQDEFRKKYDLGDNLPFLEQPSEFIKKDSLIRNPPGLFPVNPFAFFIPETKYETVFKKDTGFFERTFTSGESMQQVNDFYNSFLAISSTSDGKIKNFKSNTTPGFGKLRNIWVNIKEIQKAFGISNPDSTDTSTSNINPPGTLDVAINNLLSSLNSNFHEVWDFELGVDPYDSTNIRIIDKSDSEIKNPQYTKYQENSNLIQDEAGGIFQFPTFKAGSFVKNQNLTFKIPSAQAITILYGSNKPNKDNDPEFANGQLDKIFRNNNTKEFDDAYLNRMQSSHNYDGAFANSVGSDLVDPNSIISFLGNFGIKINPLENWWKKWTPDIDEAQKKNQTSKDDKSKDSGYYDVIQTPNGPQVRFFQYGKGTSEDLYDIDDTTKHLVLKSEVQYTLNSYLNSNSPVQQFDMSNLIPAELGLEIDGTGGIIPFDLIHTEYIEEKYKSELISYSYLLSDDLVREENVQSSVASGDDFSSFSSVASNQDFSERTTEQRELDEFSKSELGPLTYFQLFDVTHKVDETGWKTELNSKMRINHIPRDDFVTFVEEEEVLPEDKPFVEQPVDEPDIPVATAALPPQEIRRADGTEIEVEYVPAPVSRPNIPVPINDEDIADNETLADLDFDDIPPWIPPPYPSTLSLRRAKIEIDNQPERVPDVSPPGPPLLDVGPVLGPDEIDKLIANAITNGTALNNDTDLVEYPPEPDPRAEPALPSQPIRRGGDYGNLNPLSLLDQIKSQKIIHVQPAFDLVNETGEVQKPQRFEAPQVQELNFESPVEATIAVNENIKKELPEVIEVETPQELNFIELKSTYKFQYLQNEILYALREDWRPLYQKDDGSLTGRKFKLDSNRKKIPIPNTNPVQYEEFRQVRPGQPKPVRQAYWDAYIEGKNESGVSQTKFVDRDNFQIFPPVEPTGDLVRRDRDIYWKGEFNPKYPLPPPQ